MEVTIKDMEEFFAKYSEVRAEYDELTKKSSRLKEEILAMEKSATDLLLNEGLEKYTSKSGTFRFAYEATVLTPKTLEEKHAFGEWLKEQGIYEQYVNFNSISVNSLYKRQVEATGDSTCAIPGLQRGQNLLRTYFRRNK